MSYKLCWKKPWLWHSGLWGCRPPRKLIKRGPLTSCLVAHRHREPTPAARSHRHDADKRILGCLPGSVFPMETSVEAPRRYTSQVCPPAEAGAARLGAVRSRERPAPWPAHPAGGQDTAETHRGLTFSPLVNTSKSSQCSFKWGRRRFSNFSSFPPLAN